jgi:hypothetical protein
MTLADPETNAAASGCTGSAVCIGYKEECGFDSGDEAVGPCWAVKDRASVSFFVA